MKAYVSQAIGEPWLLFIGALTLGLLTALFPTGTPLVVGAILAGIVILVRPILGLAFIVGYPTLLTLGPYFTPGQATASLVISGGKDVLLVATAWFLVMNRIVGKKPPMKDISPLKSPIITFVYLGIIYSFIAFQHLEAALLGFRNLFEYTILYWAVQSVIKTEYELQVLVKVLLFTGVIPIVSSLVILTRQQLGLGYQFGVMSEHIVGRLSGFQGDYSSGLFGTYASVMVIVAFTLLTWPGLREKASSFAWFLFLLMPLSLIAVLFSFSRRAWLALGLFGPILMWINRHNFSKRTLTGLGVTFIVGLTALILKARAWDVFVVRSTDLDPGSVVNIGRLTEWRELFLGVVSHWFLGEGLGSVGNAALKLNISGGTNTHNIYLLVLVQMGVFGFGSLLWILVRYHRYVMANWKNASGWCSPVALAAWAGAGMIAFQSLFSTALEVYPTSMYFWFLLAVGVSAVRLGSGHAHNPEAGQPKAKSRG